MRTDGGSAGGEGRGASAPAPGGAEGDPGADALAARFVTLTRLLYDTSVPLDVLERDVIPHIAPDIDFTDPWVHTRGLRIFRAGLRGFHCTFPFDFTVAQAAVQMNARGDGGRAIVDGVMNLRSFVVYTYPLRTTLVYEFTLRRGGAGFVVHRLNEMWSLGDLLNNIPGLGRLYDLGRFGWGLFFGVAFRISCAIATRVRPGLRGRTQGRGCA